VSQHKETAFRPLWRCFFYSFWILAILSFTLLGLNPVQAQDGGGNGDGQGEGERVKYVERVFTQYTWQLSTRDGVAVCKVIVTHEGIPTNMEALGQCEKELIPATATPTAALPTTTATPGAVATPTIPASSKPIDIDKLLQDVYWRLLRTETIKRVEKVVIPPVIIDIQAPNQPVTEPYITIRAFEPDRNYQITSIQGLVDGNPFTCNQSACDIYLVRDSQITYWATSTFGDESPHLSATVRLSKIQDFYSVAVTSRSMYYRYVDVGLDAWKGIYQGNAPSWTFLPQSPAQLYINKALHLLASKLIAIGIVNTQDCPNGGITYSGAPNACGIEKSQPASEIWQNRFNNVIWNASRDSGVSAKLIKAMIEQETQFWPERARPNIYDEFGLAQLNELGADVSLRWNQELYQRICSAILAQCPEYYASLSTFSQAMIRGALLQLVDSNCPTCQFGLDLNKAEESIYILADSLKANAYQTGYIMEQRGLRASYEDLWRFTVLSYHAGYNCLEYAVATSALYQEPITWGNVSRHIYCEGAREYVDSIWNKLEDFSDFHPPAIDSNAKIYFPTQTPMPTATANPGLVNGGIHIVMFVDYNNNLRMDEGEKVSGEIVKIELDDKTQYSGKMDNGELHFYFQNKLVGQKGKAVAVNLYQSFEFTIPKSGEVLIVFRLQPPKSPIRLP
jgi:hypothetical protein